MIKRGIFFLLIAIVIISCVSAQSQQTLKAYSWLESKTVGKWHTLTTRQHVFSLLALQNKIEENKSLAGIKALISKSYNNGTCFGKATARSEAECSLAETAIAKLGLDLLGQNSKKAEEWLLNKTLVFYPSNAYLQIIQPIASETECRIIYDENFCDVKIDREDKVIISQQEGNCFSVEWPYALKIRPECMKKVFNITCNETSKINFLFNQERDWYVFGETIEIFRETPAAAKVESYCIGQGNCNYEATLWTALAIKEKASLFLPYLLMQKNFSENKKFVPDAFLYKITGKEIFALKVASLQRQDGLWQESQDKYYDTALVLWLAKEKVNETKAKEKLLSEQTRYGSWECATCDSILDTAFLLFAAFPYSRSECELAGFDCVINCSAAGGTSLAYDCFQGECCNLSRYGCEERYGICKASCDASEVQLSYACNTGVCCKEKSRASCISELRGKICLSNQICVNALGNEIPFTESLDARCCLGNCTEVRSCSLLGGEICNPEEGKSCARWLSATEDFCCQRGYCFQGSLMCRQQQGEICDADEDCTGQFVVASDTNNQAICCVQGECVPKTCNNKCSSNERCSGRTYRTAEGLCCEGTCLKSCAAMNGTPCNASYVCKGQLVSSYDFSRCCIGTCKKKAGFPFWILIIVAVGGIAFYFFLTKKKPKQEESLPTMPSFPPARTYMPIKTIKGIPSFTPAPLKK